MNSHQRRISSRRRHMLLPLSKEIDLATLRLRRVYSYRLGCDVVLFPAVIADIAIATVHRHVRPGFGGRLDLKLIDRKGSETVICTSSRGIRLKNPLDRAMRPWWIELRRERAGSKRSKS